MKEESYLEITLVNKNHLVYHGTWPLNKTLLPMMKRMTGKSFWKLVEEQMEVKN